jgi:hypothetical protein
MRSQQAIYWPELSSLGTSVRVIAAAVFATPLQEMPTKNDNHIFEGSDPSTLFREFAAECMELAQTNPEKRALYLKMASVWHQMAQRWEKKKLDSP